MATKRAPTTWHLHTKRVQWNINHNPYLPIRGWEEWEQNQQMSQAVNSIGLQRSAKQSKAKQSKAVQNMQSIYMHIIEIKLCYQPLQTKRST